MTHTPIDHLVSALWEQAEWACSSDVVPRTSDDNWWAESLALYDDRLLDTSFAGYILH